MYFVTAAGGHSDWTGTVHSDDPDIPIARTLTGISDFVTSRRETGLNLTGRIAGQSGGGMSMDPLDIKIGVG